MRVLRFLVGGILGVALLVAIVFGLIALGSNEATQCPVCEEVKTSSLPVAPQADYRCNAVMVGGPVATDGSCSFCTINYSYPGEVYIATENAIKYTSGAWVFQYESPQGDTNAYTACIKAQPFITDPDYTAVWPSN